jgi:hypothetical protein
MSRRLSLGRNVEPRAEASIVEGVGSATILNRRRSLSILVALGMSCALVGGATDIVRALWYPEVMSGVHFLISGHPISATSLSSAWIPMAVQLLLAASLLFSACWLAWRQRRALASAIVILATLLGIWVNDAGYAPAIRLPMTMAGGGVVHRVVIVTVPSVWTSVATLWPVSALLGAAALVFLTLSREWPRGRSGRQDSHRRMTTGSGTHISEGV